jgi:DHA1 family tetracycline resistance protein-like MFS transporter
MGLCSIIGPLSLTQTLSYFTQPGAPVYFPGAAFVLAATLAGVCLTLLLWQLRRRHAVPRVEATPLHSP